jgi:hypothetical protein
MIFKGIFSDISVSTASLPTELDGVTTRGVLWQIADGRLLLDVPSVARYLVESGRSITVDSAPDVTQSKIEYFLMMLPLAALVYQRGMLAFHAAVVSNEEGTVLLAGKSGSGKSTLLAFLLERGWQMMADDLAIVGLDGEGKPVVYPVAPGIALWPDSMKQLGIASNLLECCDANRREYTVPEHFDSTPRRLLGIYHITVNNKREVECEELAGGSRFQETGTMLYNSYVADVLCDRADYLQFVAALIKAVPYRTLRRPRDIWCLEALANHISSNFGVS